MIGIYKIENLITHKVYIGQSKNIKNRWKEHIYALNNDKHINIYLQRAWNKYGQENFNFESLEECTKKELNNKETYWFNIYYPNVYNLHRTGDSHNMSQEIKDKISKSEKGKVLSEKSRQKIREKRKLQVFSKETRLKMAENMKRRNRARKGLPGHKLSGWHKQRISLAQKGRKRTQEEIEKNRINYLGRKHTEEAKIKIRSYKHTEEAKKKISEGLKKAYKLGIR